MVFTEGTDIPRVETVIVARPTQSESLYAQMVGRGLRLYPRSSSMYTLSMASCIPTWDPSGICTRPRELGQGTVSFEPAV